MFSPETLEKLNRRWEAEKAAKRKEKEDLLNQVGKCETIEDLRNCLGYIVDRYIIKE